MAKIKGFYKSLLLIAVPIILQNLLQTFVNMLDTVMVGQLGSAEIAAVGLGNQIFFILNMILFGISSGASIFVAQFWGKKDLCGIRKTLGISLSFSTFISLIFFAGAVFAPQFLMSLYIKDSQVIQLGAGYLRIVGISYPLFAITFAYQIAFRSTEHTMLPMVSTASAFVLNALLNYVLIFGAGPFPAMGVRGAATATICSRTVEFLITVIYGYAKKFEAAGNPKEMIAFDRGFFARFLKIAFPVIVNETLWGLGCSVQNAIFSHASTDAIASYNITSTISQLTWVFFIGVGNGAAIIIGKSIGQGDNDLAKKYAFRFSWFMPLTAVFIGALLYPLSLLLPFMFNVEPHIIRQAQFMLYVLMCFYPLNAFNMNFIVGVCRSGGDTVYGAVNDLIWMWLIGIPAGCVAAFVFHASPWVIYIFLCSEQIFKATAGILRIKSGKWLNNVTVSD